MSYLLAMNLKLFRKQKGLSQSELADKVNVSLMSIRRYETLGEDNRDPQADVLAKIALALDVSVADLLSEGRDVNIIDPLEERNRSESVDELLQLTKSLNEKGLRKTADYMYDLIKIKEYKIGN